MVYLGEKGAQRWDAAARCARGAPMGAGTQGRALQPRVLSYLSSLSMRMQPSMISFSSGTFTL